MNTNVRIGLCVLGLFFSIFCSLLVGFGGLLGIILGCIAAPVIFFITKNEKAESESSTIEKQSESSTIEKQIDDTTIILLYILSFFIPLAGFIVGAIYASKDEEHYKHIGKNCLIFSVMNIILGFIIIAVMLGSM